jgi:hypothetical protein
MLGGPPQEVNAGRGWGAGISDHVWTIEEIVAIVGLVDKEEVA